MVRTAAMLLLTMAIMLLTSCRTERIVYVPQTRTEYVVQQARDSIYLRDSVFVTERIKGDTIYIYRDRWRTEYRDRWRTDTICRTDSIAYPVEVPKIEYRTPLPMRILAGIGLLALLLLVLRLIRT